MMPMTENEGKNRAANMKHDCGSTLKSEWSEGCQCVNANAIVVDASYWLCRPTPLIALA
jgi:hypothetical protein